jgi:hypothetical protein
MKESGIILYTAPEGEQPVLEEDHTKSNINRLYKKKNNK